MSGAMPCRPGLAGAEAPEPPSRLGPTGGIPCAKVVRDGKVAVLYSPGFGAGWYSWETEPALLFDPEIVAAVEADDQEAIHARAEQIKPGGYFGGADQLTIEWLPVGTIFRIDEYDGSESVYTQSDYQWFTA
jgi:hypothetical protein